MGGESQLDEEGGDATDLLVGVVQPVREGPEHRGHLLFARLLLSISKACWAEAGSSGRPTKRSGKSAGGFALDQFTA